MAAARDARISTLLLLAGAIVVTMGGGTRPAAALQALNCSSDVSAQLVAAAGNQVQNYGCGTPTSGLTQEGPDDVYEFTCQITGPVTVTLSGLDCDLDLYVLDDTCDPAACAAGSTQTGTTDESIAFTCIAGEVYVLVVEGQGFEIGGCAADEGNYVLDFGISGAGGCFEDCDNATDDDSSGSADCADPICALDPACGGPALAGQGICAGLVFVPGDLNEDGQTDVLDATVLRRDLAGLGPGIAQTCAPRCGNAVLDPGEVCELGTPGSSCSQEGFDFGTTACTPGSCALDTSGCKFWCDPLDPEPVCGPGIACWPAVSGDSDCAGPTGSGTQGTPCSDQADCAATFACSVVANQCNQWCDVDFPLCPDGTSCFDVQLSAFGGDVDFGLCF